MDNPDIATVEPMYPSSSSPVELTVTGVMEGTAEVTAQVYSDSGTIACASATISVECAPSSDSLVTGDFDRDGDVDMDDLAVFTGCASGPDIPLLGDGCTIADIDEDGDVDQSDFGSWQHCYSGPDLCPSEDCTEIPSIPPPPRGTDDCDTCEVPLDLATRGGKGTLAPRLNPAKGNVSDVVPGLAISAVGGGLGVNFHYDSDLADSTNSSLRLAMGYGWTHTYEMSLLVAGPDIVWLKGNGHVSYFREDFGDYVPKTGEFATLSRLSDQQFGITTTMGTTYLFTGPVTGVWPGKRYLLTRISDRNNLYTTFDYDSDNLLVQVVDSFNNVLNFAYDASRRLTQLSDAMGREVTCTYDPTGSLDVVTLADGTQIEYSYNTRRQIIRKTISGTALEQYELSYDPSSHRFRSIRDADGKPLYSAEGKDLWQVDKVLTQAEGTMRYVPGAVSIVDARGNVWRYSYDPHGLITRIEAPLVDGQAAVQLMAYDPVTLRIATKTDPRGHVTQYQYDSIGNMTQIIDAQNNVTQMLYQHSNIGALRTRKIEPDGDEWRWQHDVYGNLVREIDPEHGPNGPSTTCTYDSDGRLSSMSDRNGHITSYAYDDHSRLIRQTVDPGGLNLITEYDYDLTGRRTSEVDPRGITTTNQYDPCDRMISTTIDPGGLDLVTSYEYDSRGNRLKLTNPRGYSTMYTYDARDRMITVSDALNHVTAYEYDDNGNPTQITDANGSVARFEYDARNRKTRQIEDAGAGPDDLNITTDYHFDAADNLTRETRLVAPGDGSPRVMAYSFDELDRVISITQDPSGLNLIRTFGYAPLGGGSCGCSGTPGDALVHVMTDPEGKVTYFHYDKLDRRTKVVRKVGDIADNGGDDDDAISERSYDPVGNLTAIVVQADPSPDLVETYEYDAADRRIRATLDPQGADLVDLYGFDPDGNEVSWTAPNGNVTTSVYDRANRVTSMSDQSGPLGSFAYDANGNLTQGSDGNGSSNAYRYDEVDRTLSVTDDLGNSITYDYDALDNVTRWVDRNGHVTRFEYDGFYRPTAVVRAATGGTDEPIDIRSEFSYDAQGNLRFLRKYNTTQGGPQQQVIEFQYDAANRQVREISADDEDGRPRDRSFTYDGANNIIMRVDQNRDETHYLFDDLHRLTQRSHVLHPSSPAYPVDEGPDLYGYDRSSRLISAIHQYAPPDPHVTVTYEYDGAARVVRRTQDGRAIENAYTTNTTVHRMDVTYPSMRHVQKDYDLRSRLHMVSDQPAGGAVASREYDLGNRLTHEAFGNSTESTWDYNGNNWITRVTHANGPTPFIDIEYGYDNEGNPLFARQGLAPDASELYRYDADNRLIDFGRGVLSESNDAITSYTPYAGLKQRQQWLLDEQGNWLINQVRRDNVETCEERSANKANEYWASVPGQTCPSPGGSPMSLSYDDNGNLTVDPAGAFGMAELRYEYDAENRLTRVRRTSDNAILSRYYYDAEDHLVRKVVTNTAGYDGTTQYLFNERWQTLAEYDQAGLLLREYVYGAYIGEPLTMDRNLDGDGTAIGPADQRLYYHSNMVHSVVGLSDGAGVLREAYAYDAYGLPISITDGGDADNQVNFNDDDVRMVGGGSAFGNPHFYTGQKLEPESGMYQYRHRFYSPALGRFTTRDPLGYSSLRRTAYEYVDSNPVNGRDFLGLKRDCAGGTCNIYIKRGKLKPLPHWWMEYVDYRHKWHAPGVKAENEGKPITIVDVDDRARYEQDAAEHVQLRMRYKDCCDDEGDKIGRGTYRGKKCCEATCFHAVDCLEAVIKRWNAKKRAYHIVGRNCGDFPDGVVRHCCLCYDGFDDFRVPLPDQVVSDGGVWVSGDKNIGGTGNEYDQGPAPGAVGNGGSTTGSSK